MTKPRRPLAAAALGVPLSGLGHVYAGRPLRGAAILLAMGLLSYIAFQLIFIGPAGAIGVLFPVGVVVLVRIWSVFDAAVTARRAAADYILQWYNRWYLYLAIWVVIALVISPLWLTWLRAHVAQAFRVPAGSMTPTILIGDYLFVNKGARADEVRRRGAIVVFRSIEEPDLLVVKRIIATPGDTIAMHAGEVELNGHTLTEPYVVRAEPPRTEDPEQRAKMRLWQERYLAGSVRDQYDPDLSDWGPIVVPPDSVFVLGDDRQHSYDSRYYGFVPFANLLGRPEVIYFSRAPDAPSASPQRKVRWERIGRHPS